MSTTAEALEALENIEGLRADLESASRVVLELQAELATERAANALEVTALQAQREAEILAHRETMRERDALREVLEHVRETHENSRRAESKGSREYAGSFLWAIYGSHVSAALATPTGEKP